MPFKDDEKKIQIILKGWKVNLIYLPFQKKLL